MKIAYLVNQYPKVSHSFIRREILALEQQGFDVQRISVNGWDLELVDQEDASERAKTRYILRGGLKSLAVATLRTCLSNPGRFIRAFKLAFRMGWRAERPLLVHFIYLAEACLLVPWLKESGARILHVHFGTNAAEVAMLAHELGGPPYSITVHGSEEWDKPQFIGLPEKIRRSVFVVGVTSYARSQLYRWTEFASWGKVHVVHCGIDKNFHEGADTRFPATTRLVCVGRLCEQKGQLLLVTAVALLAKKGIIIELVLAGDGEMRPQIESLIALNNLQKQITITGWITSEQVRDEILAARALVLTSFAEGLPVVVMEAMALRRPVLTTQITGIPELVRAGETGWLIPPGDIDAIVGALETVVNTPLPELEAMGDAAYRRVLERHSIDTEAAKMAVLFREAVKS